MRLNLTFYYLFSLLNKNKYSTKYWNITHSNYMISKVVNISNKIKLQQYVCPIKSDKCLSRIIIFSLLYFYLLVFTFF